MVVSSPKPSLAAGSGITAVNSVSDFVIKRVLWVLTGERAVVSRHISLSTRRSRHSSRLQPMGGANTIATLKSLIDSSSGWRIGARKTRTCVRVLK